MLLFHNSSAWASALVPHQSGKGHASSAWREGPVQKTWRPWQPSRLQRATQPRAHTHPGLPVGTTVCLNLNIHLAPEEQTASSLFTLCGSCHLSCGNPDVLLATTTALASSPPGLCHGSYCCLYSLSETGRGGCSGFPRSTTICPSDWTLNRTFTACVAFSFTLSIPPPPSARGNPGKASPVIPASPEEGNHFQSDSRRTQGHAAPPVASQSTGCSLPPLS